MKKNMNYTLIVLLIFAFVGVQSVKGQEWSKDQLEVWQEVENGWAAWKSGDTEKAFAGISDKYLGWNTEAPLPISKEKWKSKQEQYKDYVSVEYYDLQPARIVVTDDNAAIYYFFEFSMVFEKDGKKKEINTEGRNVEFYVKEKGKWKLFGDMTYFENDDDD
jgi:hypothetical protein